MTNGRDLERVVKIAAPYDTSVEAEVLLESVPVWFDLGWQKVDGEDYGLYNDVQPAAAESNPSYEFRTSQPTGGRVESQTGSQLRQSTQTSQVANPPSTPQP